MDWNELHAVVKGWFHPQPITKVVDGREYAIIPGKDGAALGSLVVPPSTPRLNLSSLTGFRDAFAANIDAFDEGKFAAHVVDHNTVNLISLEADEFGRRQVWLEAVNRETNPFPFDQYQQPEQFLMSLQAGFLPTEEIVQLQKLASALSNDSSVATQDDGFTQTVTVKQGAVTRGESVLPKRIKLYPYRTFREVDPVESEFIVRLKGQPGQLPTIALIQVDAGKWKHDTALMVKRWLASELPEGTVVIA